MTEIPVYTRLCLTAWEHTCSSLTSLHCSFRRSFPATHFHTKKQGQPPWWGLIVIVILLSNSTTLIGISWAGAFSGGQQSGITPGVIGLGLLGFNASATARVISRRWNDDDEISYLVEETGVPGGNHRRTASNWWNCSHIRPLPSPVVGG